MEGRAKKWIAVGFSSWKKKFTSDFLGDDAAVRFMSVASYLSSNALNCEDNIVVWSSAYTEELHKVCSSNGQRLYRMEDGFVRSVGLGVDLVRPISLVLDTKGIYYDACQPSDLEEILNHYEFDTLLLDRANGVISKLVEGNISKYNIGDFRSLSLPTQQRTLLVPGQVETDASISKGSPSVKTNLELLTIVRSRHPDAFIIYKPHPDVVCGGRYESSSQQLSSLYDIEVVDISISHLLNVVDEVHTMTSLVGFEALLRGVKVETYGLPFYAGWGLTHDYLFCERRQRNLSLQQLVAGTLLLYPIYIDPLTRQRITCEEALDFISANLHSPTGPSVLLRLERFIKRVLGIKQG